MEDEERQKKLEAGKAKLAEYRQRKAQADGQSKPRRKKKGTRAKESESAGDEGDPDPPHRSRGSTLPPSTEFTIGKTLRSGETVTHDQTYTIEPESEVSTTAEDCSSEEEEDQLLSGSHSEHEAPNSQTRLQMVKDELAVRSQEVEELSRELREIRAAFGTEGVQQLQDFEAAIKDRDGIITQLTANLQQARKEKDEIMREFLEMTEQSQKLQIQFQQLQAGETLRNTSHSTTAADLLHAKQQIVAYQQQIREQDAQLKVHRECSQEQLLQISQLQDQLTQNEMLAKMLEESFTEKLKEKDFLISEHESSLIRMKEGFSVLQKTLDELNAQIAEKNQELEVCRSELAGSKQRERMSSGEIQQLMATVEDLQKRCHRENQSESDIMQRVERDLARKMDELQVELDEMYGQQIVQMKQELRLQHSQEVERLTERHRVELERLAVQPSADSERVSVLNVTIDEMRQKLREAQVRGEKANQELTRVSEEKMTLQSRVDDLLRDLRTAKEKVERASQSITYQEQKLSEAEKLRDTISNLQAQLAATAEATKELEDKHESEVTNYKIKLEMLEREKDAVLDLMAESQEAELERLRTQLLFSHEEELSRLREDLQRENLLNIENLKDELALKHKQGLERMQKSLEEQLWLIRSEKDGMASERDGLVLEVTALRNKLNESLENNRSEEMAAHLRELEEEIVELRKEEQEKGTLEKEIQELRNLNDHLEKQASEKEASWGQKHRELECKNAALQEANVAIRQEVERIEHLTAENQQLNKRIIDLMREAETQRNTFSFAEKNFEVNYQELKDEYTCLVTVKAELEEKLLKRTLESEEKLRELRSQIQQLQGGRKPRRGNRKAGKMDEDFYDAVELLEKDTSELMEKLEVAQREKSTLLLQLSDVSQQLAMKESRVELLEVELEAVKVENLRMVERIQAPGGKLEESREGGCQEQWEWERLQLRGGDCFTGDPFGRAASPEDQSSLQCSEERCGVLERENRAPRERAAALGGAPVEESPTSLAPLSNGERPRQRGAAEDSVHVELQEKERARAAAEDKIRDLNARLCMLRAWRSEDGQEAGQLDSSTINEDDFRLQMEAQRISLSQIHAAQLELQRENLQADKEAALRGLELELRSSHSRELERLREEHQREPRDMKGYSSDHEEMPRSLKFQNLIQVVSEECGHLVQLLEKAFGEEFMKHLLVQSDPPKNLRALEGPVDVVPEEDSSTSLLTEAKEVCSKLQLLKDCIFQEFTRLADLQELLRDDLSKQEALQVVHGELKSGSEKEPAGLHLPIDSGDVSPRKPNDPAELPETRLGEAERLKVEFQERQAQLEQWHSLEIKRLRTYYQQQAKDTEERYAIELLLLQHRLQELTGAEVQFRVSPETPSSGSKKEESGDVKGPEAERQDPVSLIQTLEKQHQEKVEEEIAKVIVQMSVGFAQQMEGARLAKQARETSSGIQTQSDELGWWPEGDVPRHGERDLWEAGAITCPPGVPEELDKTPPFEESIFSLQMAKRESELKYTSPGDVPDGESRVLQKPVPVMQSSSTQTELALVETEEDEKEPIRRGGAKPATTSHDLDESELHAPDLTTERNLLRKANESLRQVLSDVLKTTAAAEETIGCHVEGLLEATSRGQPPHRSADASSDGFYCSEARADEMGLQFRPELQLENEEDLMSISSRLQAAVEKLLVAINMTTNQLEHARVTQTELMRESFRHTEEMGELQRRQEELQEQLAEEAKAREQLALELQRAEGLIDGYSEERSALEARLQEKEGLQLNLEQELRTTGSRLRELEQDRELLARQQGAMRDVATPRELCLVEAAVDAAPEADLLEETEKLMKEKVEVQRQAEKDSSDLLKQVRCLEVELEEQVSKFIELEEAHRADTTDLRQQIQALEKQLENNRKFLDEQAIDREQERDVFQQEITKLEQQLKNSQKSQPSTEQHREVDQLTIQLKEKSDWCSELLLGSEQLQRDIQERNEEIEKLEARVRELEQALLATAESPRKGEDQRRKAPMQKTDDSTLEAQLQTEREALDRKEKEISNLEEQLEQFREELENKSEEVQQLQMQLEIQRKELNTQQEDLEHKSGQLKVIEEKNELLRELESQVECLRSEQERLRRNNEDEVDQLNDVIEKLQQELSKIEHKISEEYLPDTEDLTGTSRDEVSLSKEEFDEMKQQMDQTTQELNTLKASHNLLLEKYRGLEEEKTDMLTAKENERSHLEEALQEKTAATVVMQAQIQALEQSASSTVAHLTTRVEELEACVEEKDSELAHCGLRVEQAQAEAGALQLKISGLEDKLREKMAALLVSQAQLSAVQLQSEELQTKELCGQTFEAEGLSEPSLSGAREGHSVEGPSSIPETPEEVRKAGRTPAAKVVHLAEKLKELEAGLRDIQKDQEIQKHLLTSSEEEVVEYEKRLAGLINLLNQMITNPTHRISPPPCEGSGRVGEDDADSGLLQQLRAVQQEAAAAEEELRGHRERSDRLEKELQVKELTISQLQEDLRMQSGWETRESELLHKLQEVQQEAAVTKEELSAYRERCSQLQREIEEREMTIANLQEDLLQQASDKENKESPAGESELLQELREVRQEAAAAKEELNTYRERSAKLKEELQLRDDSLAKLGEELRQATDTLAKTQEELAFSKKRKGSKHQEKTQVSSTKEKPSIARRDSVSQTDRTAVLSGSCQTERVVLVDAEIQEDLPQPGPDASEEIAEVISEYDERIGQMQELHAAEIMDMEARHISESEALKEECRALNAIIERLRAAESVSSRPEQPMPSKFRDEYASDSSSDWSQRISYDLPTHNQELRSTPEGARRDNETGPMPVDILPDRIKTLLREVHHEGMQVLSLSELPLLEADQPPLNQRPQGWLREREALLASINSLKALISRMQTLREEQSGQPEEGVPDWRAELLRAVQQVLASERGVLKSALYAHLDQLDTSDVVVHLNQLEHRLSEQETQHRETMEALHSADRHSLLMEVQHLQAQIQQVQQDSSQMRSSIQRLTPSPSPGERHGSPSSCAGPQDLRGLPSDRMVLDELKGELAQTKLELETTLKAQHKHLKALETLRCEVTEKAAEVDRLMDALSSEQKKTRELQWAFEKEKCKWDKNKKQDQEELEDLRLALEEQQGQATQLRESLEQQYELVGQLQREVDAGRAQLSRVQGRASELRVQLESARARALELAGALEREREARLPHGAAEGEEAADSTGALLAALRAQLDEKHGQVVRLVEEVERYKLEAVQAQQQRDEDEQANRHNSEQEQEARLKALQTKARERQRQLENEKALVLQLQREKTSLEDRIEELLCSAQHAKAGDATGTPWTPTLTEQPAQWEGENQPNDRTRDWVLQQKMTADPGTASPEAPEGGPVPANSPHVAAIVNRLQLIATKIRTMVNRMPVEEVDSKALAWLQGSIQNVMSLVQQLPAVPPVPEGALTAGGPSSSLTERLLRQNAELTGFVSRLTEEKNDLRNTLLRLEEELRSHRQRCPGTGGQNTRRTFDDQATLNALLSSEREAWSSERSRLQKSLRQAEAQVSRLRAEIRIDSLRDVAGTEADGAALKRIYGKYLRAESFRKALIYQKKYLLLLLGGFQECEEATLSLIARMGGRPPHSGLEVTSQRRSGLTRFRSAVRVSIAVSRMRFLVRRWQKATGSGSSSSCSVNRNGMGQITGSEVRTDSPYLHPGGLEVCGERRGTSRGRTGPESPRLHTVTDIGTLACSHLQNYDPDRALTDYISRLEALQRRLGSVQSGSASYAQLHFGIRR